MCEERTLQAKAFVRRVNADLGTRCRICKRLGSVRLKFSKYATGQEDEVMMWSDTVFFIIFRLQAVCFPRKRIISDSHTSHQDESLENCVIKNVTSLKRNS